jgi:Asp/Glu/hydantoin racemase
LKPILLINPNSSTATTTMMVNIAASCAPAGVTVVGASATRAPGMITDGAALAAAVHEVIEIGVKAAPDHSAIIVAAFGDPGLAQLRARLAIPVTGLCEAAMLEASAGGRRYGVATVTPDLVEAIDGRAADLGLGDWYAGIRLTHGDPLALAGDPQLLVERLADAVTACIEIDGARAVIIGGGPLGQAAVALAPRFTTPVIAPLPAAMRQLLAQLGIAP